MALTLAIRLQAMIVDGLNTQAIATAYATIDPGATFSAISTEFQAWVAAIDAMSDGQVTAAWLSAIPALPSGIKTAATDASRVEQTGVLNFSATGTPRRWGEAIPALSTSSTVVSGGKIVLTTGDPAAQLAALMTTPSSDLEYTNEGGQPLSSLRDTLISFRKYPKQLASATYERAV